MRKSRTLMMGTLILGGALFAQAACAEEAVVPATEASTTTAAPITAATPVNQPNDWTQMNQATREASVVTPEHVMLRFQTAGVGSRATAQLIDMVLLFLVNITVFILFSIAFFGNNDL